MEEWRDIPGWEGLYQASSLGQIRSIERMVPTKGGALRLSRSRILRGGGPRYDLVILTGNGHKASRSVHRLICLTFHGQPPAPNWHAAHRDGNRKNNRQENLHWSTARQNCADRERHGTWAHGERINTNKLRESEARAIRARSRAGECTKALAAEFGVHRSSVQQIMRGVTWKHLTD